MIIKIKMKNINVSNISQSQEIEAFVQFKIMEGMSEKLLSSLENPVDIIDARNSLRKIISENKRYREYLPLTDDVLDKILALAFYEDKEIDKVLEIFIRKHASDIAKAKIDTVMKLWIIANNPTYINKNEIDYSDKESFL